ncbi:5770_t:CDS:1, partial [Dentiscutata heterogama]
DNYIYSFSFLNIIIPTFFGEPDINLTGHERKPPTVFLFQKNNITKMTSWILICERYCYTINSST